MRAQSEDQLLELLVNQNTREEGFRVLMVTYQERIYWHIRKMVYEHEDTNDIVQNTFIKAYRGIQRFRGKSKLYTWLYKIATNETITFLNQRKRKQTESIDNAEYNLAGRLQTDVFFDGDEVQLLLQKAIARLPVKQRLVFNMKYFDNLSYKEISAILETSEGALKASYHHAVKKIEQFVKDVQV